MRGTLEERFWAKVDKRGPDECWPWIGTTSNGYGHIRGRNGRMCKASHVALELAGRPLPAGMDALHSCDNPPCCNERHLFHGTDADNAADRDRKGRRLPPKGEKNGRAKLGSADVQCIRRSLENGISQDTLSRLFGVSQTQVSRIRRRKLWTHSV